MAALRRILGKIAWGLAGLLIVLFLVGYAAPFLPPYAFWWANLVAVLVPALGGGVGVLAIGGLGYGIYRQNWGQTAGALVLIGLLAVRFGLPGWWEASYGDDPETLSVMTLNVPPSSVQDWTTGALLSRFVHQQAPDVLALQESWVKTGAERPAGLRRVAPSLRSLLADSSAYDVARGLPSEETIQQPVLGRLSLDSTSVHPLPPLRRSEPRSQYTRTAFTWRGRSAVLYNVHLHSIGPVRPWTEERADGWLARWGEFLRSYRMGAFWRAEQARLLRRRIEAETDPVLVVGDFNSTPHQWAYWHLGQGLQSASPHHGWGGNATYPAGRPLVRIDHVLASPAWDIVTARVPGEYWGPSLSDHRPVMVQLRWRATKAD